MFKNRIEAGQQLAKALSKYKRTKNTIVLAVPRGGVPPAAVVADELNLPLDLIMVKKIGHPQNKEYAIGAVSAQHIWLDKKIPTPQPYIEKETKQIQEKLRRHILELTGTDTRLNIKGKTVIIIDDGIATGYTIMAAVHLAREDGATKVVVAVPVGAPDTIQELEHLSDEVVCLEQPDPFSAIGMHYENFGQITSQEVRDLYTKFHNN